MPHAFIDTKPGQATRVLDGIERVNAYAASEQYGASLREITAVHKAVVARAELTAANGIAQDDLVARLIADDDNKDIWETQLLGNQFAKDMAATGPSDKDGPAVLAGFRAYMIQDYLYAVSGISFQSERLPKAVNAKGTKDNLDKISDFCGYSKNALDRCLQDLGIPESQLIGVQPTDVLKKYIQTQLSAAENNDWVMGLVAIIPCVVSQYMIATNIYKDATAKVKQTLWYSLWVVPNASATGTPAELVNILSSFFVANCDAWKYRYDDAKKIFQTACSGEVDLWNYAEAQKGAAGSTTNGTD